MSRLARWLAATCVAVAFAATWTRIAQGLVG